MRELPFNRRKAEPQEKGFSCFFRFDSYRVVEKCYATGRLMACDTGHRFDIHSILRGNACSFQHLLEHVVYSVREAGTTVGVCFSK